MIEKTGFTSTKVLVGVASRISGIKCPSIERNHRGGQITWGHASTLFDFINLEPRCLDPGFSSGNSRLGF